ncbi:hypothetical protein FBEOM_9821 [Fusarium beomiforme]|uniref:Uncharacterized protein n=1 Tax=Fusarium beomiforme TaxID=44412 RepID=A0A9P5ADQ8_9HYPO|nr:hypothetical protein FBEOM_9821 [Fusarium beomiforme]
MPGSITSLKRRHTAKSAAKRISRMFKRTSSDDPDATSPADSGFSKDSFDGSRVSTSSRFSTTSRMTKTEDVERSRPSVSRFDTVPPKEREVVPPHPFFSANSEPFLEHGKSIEPITPVGSTNVMGSEAPPSPVNKEIKYEPKAADKKPETQLESVEKPKDIETVEEAPKPVLTPKPAQRPLPEPPTKKAVLPEPESPVLPKKSREEPKVSPQPMPRFEEDITPKPERRMESKPKDKPVKKSTVPPPTVEDDPEPVAEPAQAIEEQTRAKPKGEVIHTSLKVSHKTVPKAQHEEVQPKMEPRTRTKSAPLQSPHIPEATQNPSRAPAAPTVTTVPKTSSVKTTSSAPKTASIPNKASIPRYSVRLSTSTIFIPKTAPAPHTARAPMTAPAPTIVTAPKVVISMLGWTLPEPAPIPKRANSPETSWIMSSA